VHVFCGTKLKSRSSKAFRLEKQLNLLSGCCFQSSSWEHKARSFRLWSITEYFLTLQGIEYQAEAQSKFYSIPQTWMSRSKKFSLCGNYFPLTLKNIEIQFTADCINLASMNFLLTHTSEKQQTWTLFSFCKENCIFYKNW